MHYILRIWQETYLVFCKFSCWVETGLSTGFKHDCTAWLRFGASRNDLAAEPHYCAWATYYNLDDNEYWQSILNAIFKKNARLTLLNSTICGSEEQFWWFALLPLEDWFTAFCIRYVLVCSVQIAKPSRILQQKN